MQALLQMQVGYYRVLRCKYRKVGYGMYFSKCYQDCAKEALKRIDFYRERKENNVFDDFYHSHLDLMQKLLEKFCQADEKYVALIMAKKRNQYEDGNSTPLYVTICKKPH